MFVLGRWDSQNTISVNMMFVTLAELCSELEHTFSANTLFVVFWLVFSQQISVSWRVVKRIEISERDAKTQVQFIRTFNFSNGLSNFFSIWM